MIFLTIRYLDENTLTFNRGVYRSLGVDRFWERINSGVWDKSDGNGLLKAPY